MNMFVKLNENFEIEQYPYTLDMFRNDNKNKSLPKTLNDVFLQQRNVFHVYDDIIPDFDTITEYCERKSNPIFDDEKNIWIIEWDVKQKTPERIQAEKEILENEIRKNRDKFLMETDWIVSKSLELGQEIPTEWKTYRQSLRDITKQSGFPYSIEWPSKP